MAWPGTEKPYEALKNATPVKNATQPDRNTRLPANKVVGYIFDLQEILRRGGRLDDGGTGGKTARFVGVRCG